MPIESASAVFICHDTVHAQLLAEIAARLQARGVSVSRGDLRDDSASAPWLQAHVIVPTIRQPCTRAHLIRASRLRGIVFPTIGVESLDLAAANELGIIVGHGATPENFIGMAEATLLLALLLLYRVDEAVGILRDGRPRPNLHAATMLHGKTAGLIGVGRIGSELAKRLSCFGVRTLACTRTRRPHPHVAAFVDLNTLLESSDVVFMLATLTAESHKMLGQAEFQRMKRTAYLVNTARGGLIDEPALYQALRDKHIAGAALDVFEVEPLPQESPLRTLDNVILTPHLVGHTLESTHSLLPAAVENIWSILHSSLPPFCKNPEIAQQWRAR
jgi:phosphoglycerate dehydrogenase-like enzyme